MIIKNNNGIKRTLHNSYNACLDNPLQAVPEHVIETFLYHESEKNENLFNRTRERQRKKLDELLRLSPTLFSKFITVLDRNRDTWFKKLT